MAVLLAFARLAELAGRAAALLAAACLAGIVLLVLGEVVARDLLGRSLSLTWEIAGYLMGATFFLGAAHTLADGAHVRAGMQDMIPSPVLRRAVEGACLLAGLFVSLYAARALALLAWQSFERGVVAWSGTGMPLAIPQGVLALGAALLALQFAGLLARIVAGEAPFPPRGAAETAEREAL